MCQIKNEDQIIQSIIYAPKLNHLFTYSEFNGYRINFSGEKLDLKNLKKRKKIKILVDNYPEPKGIAKTIVRNNNLNYLESGSISLKIMLVVIGIADLFIKDVTVRDWDVAPTLPFCKIANITITDIFSRKYVLSQNIEKKGLIVCSSDKFKKAFEMIVT